MRTVDFSIIPILPLKILIAIVHRTGVAALERLSGCKDSPVLVGVGDMQVFELLLGNPLPLSFVLDLAHL